jgi:hypothetical protein
MRIALYQPDMAGNPAAAAPCVSLTQERGRAWRQTAGCVRVHPMPAAMVKAFYSSNTASGRGRGPRRRASAQLWPLAERHANQDVAAPPGFNSGSLPQSGKYQ